MEISLEIEHFCKGTPFKSVILGHFGAKWSRFRLQFTLEIEFHTFVNLDSQKCETVSSASRSRRNPTE